jgi:hypothetical protein
MNISILEGVERSTKESLPRRRARRLRFFRLVSCRPVRPQVVIEGSKLQGWPAQVKKDLGTDYRMHARRGKRPRASRDIADKCRTVCAVVYTLDGVLCSGFRVGRALGLVGCSCLDAPISVTDLKDR